MATIRLIPSAYTRSNTSYVSVTNATSMYDNVDDSSDYATLTHSRQSTTTYYVYIHGFNFDDVPEGAIVNSFNIKIKAYESGLNTGSSYRMSLYHNTSSISGTTASTSLSSSTQIITFPTDSLTWETLKSYGNDFRIRVPLRRSSSYTQCYVYVYGAEIEVDYIMPISATVTSTISGNGTIDPSGAYSTYEGLEYTLTISPTNASDTVTATKNGTDITSSLVLQTGKTITAVANDVTTHSISSGSGYAEYAVGHSAEDPYSSTSNMYASSGSTGYAEYTFDFSDIPSSASIESIEVRCYGHRESSTIDSSHVSNVSVYVGSTLKAEEDFPSTSNSTVTLTPTITRSELNTTTLRHTVGYYGGLVLGISFDVTYELDGVVYTYTYVVDGDATIAVVIGGSGPIQTAKLYKKINGVWTQVGTAYKKANSSWSVQSDVTTVFDSSTKYKEG